MLPLLLAFLGVVPTASPVPALPQMIQPRVGVMVMAHGGSEEWNATVEAAAAQLAGEVPTVVAFGMADPVTLSAALDSLGSQGVTHVAVVRLFISGQSFRAQTEYLLGLSDTPPDAFVTHGGNGGHGGHGSHGSGDPHPIAHGLTVATHADGLIVSAEARRILAGRARNASTRAEEESVLLVAHGMGEEEENARVLDAMTGIERELAEVPFASVLSVALREDWPEKRVVAEGRIRDFVRGEVSTGRRVIIVPVRLTGFGPYAEVLGELTYTPTEGLLPDPEVSVWIRRTAARVICANGWTSPMGSCPGNERGLQPTAR